MTEQSTSSPPDPRPVATPGVRKIRRSRNERMVSGVAGGIGEYAGVDPNIVRLAFVLLAFAGGAGIVAYLIAWVLIPQAT